MKPTIDHAKKIIELLSHGLVSGLGEQKPGKMCVEAAVCFALGLPHGDDPPCVDKDVRNYKIGLNDQKWESNQARAEGMKALAIAQLGSNELELGAFKKEIFLETQKVIIPLGFDYIKEENRIPEHEKLKKFCEGETDVIKLKEKFNNYYNNNYYYYYYYYNNYYYYYYYYYKNYKPEFLPILQKLSVEVAVTVLKKLKSPGCEWLYLLD